MKKGVDCGAQACACAVITAVVLGVCSPAAAASPTYGRSLACYGCADG